MNRTLEFKFPLKNWTLNIEFNLNHLYWQINAILMNVIFFGWVYEFDVGSNNLGKQR